MEKVLLVVFGNFPTSKAYGVTTAKTIQNIKQKGHELASMAFRPLTQNSHLIDAPTMLYFKEGRVSRFLRKLSYLSFGRASQISWKLVCTIAGRKAFSRVKRYKPTTIWVRESIPKTWISRSNSNQIFVIELHSFISSKTIKNISKLEPRQIIFAPISLSILRDFDLRNLPYKSVLSPMGVDLDQFTENPSHSFPMLGSPIKIGYFGKIAPGGFSKGFEDLIYLAALHQSLNFPSEIQIVGAEISEILALEQMAQSLGIKPTNLAFISHRPHDETILLMQNCDVLVLTTPMSSTYSGSPIKAIEYAATGKPVLASRSRVNEEVFLENCDPYWYENANIESMHETLLQIFADPERVEKTRRMRAFAESRTWEIRTNRILEAVESNRKTAM